MDEQFEEYLKLNCFERQGKSNAYKREYGYCNITIFDNKKNYSYIVDNGCGGMNFWHKKISRIASVELLIEALDKEKEWLSKAWWK